jgi:NADPH:quinone reductase-like Zn-dependent oxidoreductase
MASPLASDYPALEALADLAESGKLRVHLQATLGLAEAAKAHELLESGSVTGKIALTV